MLLCACQPLPTPIQCHLLHKVAAAAGCQSLAALSAPVEGRDGLLRARYGCAAAVCTSSLSCCLYARHLQAHWLSIQAETDPYRHDRLSTRAALGRGLMGQAVVLRADSATWILISRPSLLGLSTVWQQHDLPLRALLSAILTQHAKRQINYNHGRVTPFSVLLAQSRPAAYQSQG